MFEDNLKRICKERGTTPSAILKKWGMSTSKVSAWYNGSLPKQEVLIRLAEELHCSVSDFFSEETSAPTDNEIKFALFGGDKIDEITDEMYEDVLRYAQFLKEKKMKDI